MKKLFSLIVVFTLALVLISCGGDVETTTTAAPDVTTTAADVTTTAPETTTEKPETTTKVEASSTTEATTPDPVTTTEATTTAEVAGFNLKDFEVALSIKKPEAKVPAPTYDVWDGSIATAFAGGDGTKENPYLISNGAELAYLSYLVYSIEKIPNPAAQDGSLMLAPNPTHHVYYKLTNDIYLNDVSDISSWSDDPFSVPNGVNVWIPIGVGAGDTPDNTVRSFCGYFDGAGFTVYGIYTIPNTARGGLFGGVEGTPDANDPEAVPYSGLQGMMDLGLDGMMKYAHVQNVTVSHSMISGKGFTAGIVGRTTKCAIVNCVVDESVSIYHFGSVGATVDGIAGITGRGDVWISKCINCATLRAVPEIVNKDGADKWVYCGYVSGIIGLLSGVVEECANFGDIYATYEAGLLCGFVGNSEGAGHVVDCYAEGTIHDGWVNVDTSSLDRKNLNHVGPLVGQACRQDSHLEYTIARCVSAGKFADDVEFEYFNKVGTVAGLHKEWSAVMQLLWINYGYPENIPLCSDWDTKASLIWMDIYEATPEQLAEYRAQYAK